MIYDSEGLSARALGYWKKTLDGLLVLRAYILLLLK